MDAFLILVAVVLLLLIVWGLGAPVPEESVLLLAAVLASSGHYWGFVFTCTFGIAVADTLGYARGRSRSRVFSPFKTGKQFIAGAGVFAVFTSRALISVRAVVPYMAGALKMPRLRFHLASLLGAFCSSALVIGIGKEAYLALPAEYATVLWGALIALVTGILVMYATRAQMHLVRSLEREEGAAASVSGSHSQAAKAKPVTRAQSNHKKV